jgi:PAS domain-containing protein
MKPESAPPPQNADEEIAALIETLHRTGQRLEALTAGEVDTVANRAGRTVMLRRAQEHRRHSEAARQAASKTSLQRFAAAMDATVDAIYLVDRSTMNFVYVNDAACRMRKQTRE